LEGQEQGPAEPTEQLVSTIMSASFMVLVGLSLPPIQVDRFAAAATSVQEYKYVGIDPEIVAEKYAFPGWGMIAVHVLAITVLSNLGKMFPLLCYRKDASFRERVALCFGMFPRGEVGGGVLVISIAYGIGGPALTVASLSLALNLLCTGLFIVVVKRLLAAEGVVESEPAPESGGLGLASAVAQAIPEPSLPQTVLANTTPAAPA
jgi:hypothetical protein